MLLAVIVVYAVSIALEYVLWRKVLPTLVGHGSIGWTIIVVSVAFAPLFVLHDLNQRLWDKLAKDER